MNPRLEPTFRALDRDAGWAPRASSVGVAGFDEPEGLRLEAVSPGRISRDELDARFTPPWLAHDRGTGSWWLAACEPDRLLTRVAGCDRFETPAAPALGPDALAGLGTPQAVAARAGRLAAAFRRPDEPGRVRVWSHSGEQTLGDLEVAGRTVLAFDHEGRLLLAWRVWSPEQRRWVAGVVVSDLNGILRTIAFPPETPVDRIRRLAVGRDRAIWAASIERPEARGQNASNARPPGEWRVWRCEEDACEFRPGDPEQLARSVPATAVVVSSDGTQFIATEDRARAFDCRGVSIEPSGVALPQGRPRPARGRIVFGPIDSRLARCRWGAVEIDADIPPGTTLRARTATVEPEPGGKPPNVEEIYEGDWQGPEGTAREFPVGGPPGRYLYLELRLRGDAAQTPRIRAIRVHFPRVTSLERLPEVYREDAQAEDFLERFLANLDRSLASFDREARELPRALDPDTAPPAALPMLASLLGLELDPSWSEEQVRAAIRLQPELIPGRGTPAAIGKAIRLQFGVQAAIGEASASRALGLLDAGARVGAVRLFSRRGTRFRLGTAVIGVAPLRGAGDPDDDPFAASAHRATVAIPARRSSPYFEPGEVRDAGSFLASLETPVGAQQRRAVALLLNADPDLGKSRDAADLARRLNDLLPRIVLAPTAPAAGSLRAEVNRRVLDGVFRPAFEPLPASSTTTPDRTSVRALVEAHAPGWVSVSVRVGGGPLVVGQRSAVGIDTDLPVPARAVVGASRIVPGLVVSPRLGDNVSAALRVGRACVPGVPTLLE